MGASAVTLVFGQSSSEVMYSRNGLTSDLELRFDSNTNIYSSNEGTTFHWVNPKAGKAAVLKLQDTEISLECTTPLY
jgi:hypothetical protein